MVKLVVPFGMKLVPSSNFGQLVACRVKISSFQHIVTVDLEKANGSIRGCDGKCVGVQKLKLIDITITVMERGQ